MEEKGRERSRKEGRQGKEMRKRDQNTSVDDCWWAWHNAGFSSCVQRDDLKCVGISKTYCHKVGMFGITHCYNGVHLLNQFLFLIILKVHVPLGQTSLACSVLN